MTGNLTKDTEITHLNSGHIIGKNAIASNKHYTKKDGSKVIETCFIDIAFFNKNEEFLNQYIKKGNKVLIEGRLVFNTWKDNYGNTKSKYYIMVERIELQHTQSNQNNIQNNVYAMPNTQNIPNNQVRYNQPQHIQNNYNQQQSYQTQHNPYNNIRN